MDSKTDEWCKVALRREEGEIVVDVTLTKAIPAGHKIGCGLHWHKQNGLWFDWIRDADSTLEGLAVDSIGSFRFDEKAFRHKQPADAYWIAPAVWHTEDGKWREGLGKACVSAEETVRIMASDTGVSSDLSGKKCLNEIEALIGSCGNVEAIRDKINLLRSAYDAFDHAPFILTCIGTLKSGKSTLVNIFAKCKNASPTGYGYDTTLRPALIVENKSAGDTGEIDVWLPKSNAEGDIKQDEFEQILLQECGLDNDRSAACEIGTRESPLSLDENNLKKVLCEKAHNNALPCEPMLVVVRIPRQKESVLGQCGIAVLDTPGLDSAESLWSGDRYKWIIEVSDMVLFLQSSVAALNSNAKEVIEKIREKNKAVWLIHNKFEAEPWKRSDILREKEHERESKAVGLFNDAGVKDVLSMSVNLGKAYGADSTLTIDGELNKECSRERLRQESDIEVLREKINNYLQSNKERIRKEHWSSIIDDRIKELKEEIKRSREKLTAERDENKSRIKDFEAEEIRIKAAIERDFMKGKNVSVELRSQNWDEVVKEKKAEHIDNLVKISCKDLNKKLNCIKRELWSTLEGDVNPDKLLVNPTDDGVQLPIVAYGIKMVDKLKEVVGEKGEGHIVEWLNEAVDAAGDPKERNELIERMRGEVLKAVKVEKYGSSASDQPLIIPKSDSSDNSTIGKMWRRGIEVLGWKYDNRDAGDMSASFFEKIVNECNGWVRAIESKLSEKIYKELAKSIVYKSLYPKIEAIRKREFEKWHKGISRIEGQIKELDSAVELAANLGLNK